jgi:MFS family permease
MGHIDKAFAPAARALFYLRAENLLTALSAGMLLSLPLYFDHRGYSTQEYGLFISFGVCGALAAVFFAPTLFRVLGLATAAPIGSLVVAVSCVAYLADASLAHSVWPLLLAGSLIQSAGWGLFLAQGPLCVSQNASIEARSRELAFYGLFNAIGFGLGPVIAKYLFDYTSSALAVPASSMIFAGLGTVASILASHANVTVYRSAIVPVVRGVGGQMAQYYRILQSRSVYFLIATVFIGAIYSSLMSFQVIVADFYVVDYAYYFLIYTLGVSLSRLALSKLLPVQGELKALLGLSMMIVISLLILIMSSYSPTFYYCSAAIFGISFGLITGPLHSATMRYAPKELEVVASVLSTLLYLISRYLFPAIAGLSIDRFGVPVLIATLLFLSIFPCMSLARVQGRTTTKEAS